MVRVTTSAMPADCTTRWTDKTDLWSGLERDWYGFHILNQQRITRLNTELKWCNYVFFSFFNLSVFPAHLCRLWVSGQELSVPTARRAPPHCGDVTPAGNPCATPAGFTLNYTMWDLLSCTFVFYLCNNKYSPAHQYPSSIFFGQIFGLIKWTNYSHWFGGTA